MNETQGECCVGAGRVLQPEIGCVHLADAFGVDDNELRAGTLGPQDLPPQQRHRRARPQAPHDDAAGLAGNGKGEKTGAETVGQGLAQRPRSIADLVLAHGVRAAEQIHEPLANAPIRAVKGAVRISQGFLAVPMGQTL